MKNLNYITILSLLFTIQALWAYQPSGYHWLSYDMPIPYEINQNGTPDCEGEFGAIHQAFETWENISTSWIEFNDAPNTSRMPTLEDGHNTIGWIESGWTSLPLPEPPDPEEVSIVAVQDPNFDWIIDECDQYFNGEYWEWSTTEQSYRFDVENVAAHEAGHWLELNSLFDPKYSETTMYDDIPFKEIKKRDLHSDDIAGASFLYPYEVYWPELDAITVPLLHFNADVAMAWDPTGKDVYLHLACLEGEDFASSYDTLLPLDAVVTPVRVVYVPNGVDWWQKEILSDWSTTCWGLQLELDGEDNAHIIWSEQNNDFPDKVVYRKRDAQTGIWDWPVELAVGDRLLWATIAVAHYPTNYGLHDGKVYAAWVEGDVPSTLLMFTRSHDGGASWETPQQIALARHITFPKLAIDSTGGVHVVWRESTQYGDSLCYKKNSNQGSYSSWQSTIKTERIGLVTAPSIAIDGYGYIHIATAMVTGTNERRIFYDRINNLGGGAWDSTGVISPSNKVAEHPHVVCDNLGFVHLFWDDNRNYPSSISKRDVFYSRNFHMGDDWAWESPKDGRKIYIFPPNNSPYVYVGDVAQPDTFGDLFVGVDAKWPNFTTNWDVCATLGRQDDRVRELPWPPGQMASATSMSVEEEDSLDIEPQGCYLSATLNRLSYFAPAESQLSCYSVDGRRVWKEKIKGAGHLELDFLASGTYFAHLVSTDGSSSRIRVVVIH